MNIVDNEMRNSPAICKSCGNCPWISVLSLGKKISSEVSLSLLDESIIKISTQPLVFPGAVYSRFPKQTHWNRKSLCSLIFSCRFLPALSLPSLYRKVRTQMSSWGTGHGRNSGVWKYEGDSRDHCLGWHLQFCLRQTPVLKIYWYINTQFCWQNQILYLSSRRYWNNFPCVRSISGKRGEV